MKLYNTQGMLMVSAAGTGAQGFGVSTLGNTSGTTGTASISLILVGGNNVTLSQSLSGMSATITISAFNQSVQTQNCLDGTLAGNTSGVLALISSGTLTLAGGNNITLSQNGNAVTISAFTQTVQTQNCVDKTLAGNTSGALALISSGTMTLAGGNNITLSQAGNAVTISAFAQTVQTQNCVDKTLAGNTSGTLALISSGTMTLAGGNNITLSQNGNAVTISAFNQTVQTQNCVDGTLAGNTSGTLALISSGTFTLAGGNNITLSQVGNAVTISAFNQTVQTQNCVDKTLAGNTSGTLALISSGTMTLAGGNNITLSQNGNAVTVSAFNQTVQTQNCVDKTLAGNTTGTLALISSGTMTLAGGNNITLSQNGNAVTISGAQTINFWQNQWGGTAAAGAATSADSLLVFPLSPDLAFPGHMTVSTALLNFTLSHNVQNASTQAHSYSIYFGIYTVSGSSTLNLFNSASSSFGTGVANSNISSQYNGPRYLTFNSSQWSGGSLTLAGGGGYFGAILVRSAGTNFPMSQYGYNILGSAQRSGTIGTSIATNLTMGWGQLFNGLYSTTTAGLPSSIHVSELQRCVASIIPAVVFQNILSAF